METEKLTRLEDALLGFVERAATKDAPPAEVEALPEVAKVLVTLELGKLQHEDWKK